MCIECQLPAILAALVYVIPALRHRVAALYASFHFNHLRKLGAL